MVWEKWARMRRWCAEADLEKTDYQGQCQIEFIHDVEKMQACQHGKEALCSIFVDNLCSFKLVRG
jgi:hypothetical protein